MKIATMQLEESELIALMWAVEEATESPRSFAGEYEKELAALHRQLSDETYAIHQRLQAAWLEIKK